MDAKKVEEKLVLGIRNFFSETAIRNAVIGASGGIDSAVVAALSQKALGSEHVYLCIMPSNYSSFDSERLARKLIENLACSYHYFPIQSILNRYKDALHSFGKIDGKLTEENLQARIRANLLMACSNHYNCLVLATGNKSEAMMGYCTLYGDTVGALAPIGELYKTEVYELAHYINREKEIIPYETIERAPSAELSPGQKDTDSLPPYDVLDRILKEYVVSMNYPEGIDKEIVDTVVKIYNKNRFKERYYAPTIKWRE